MSLLHNIRQAVWSLRVAGAAACVVLCLLSCSKTERLSGSGNEQLVFEPQGPAASKASVYAEEDMFGLFAYHSNCEAGVAWDDASAWPASEPYLENVVFKKNGDYWCGYDTSSNQPKPYYWPISGSLMFAGYSPYGSETISSPVTFHKNSGLVVNPYIVIPFTQKTDIDEMVDLLWFDVKDLASGKTLGKSSSAVDVLFKHALSKVTFTFADEYEIYNITDVTLKGCVNSGTFYSGKNLGWLPETDQLADYPILAAPSGSEQKLNGWTSKDMFIIPQYLNGVFPIVGTGSMDTGVDVVLSFTLSDGFGSQTIDIVLYEYTESWMPGRHYKYTVTIDADPIEFGAPTVTIVSQSVAL